MNCTQKRPQHWLTGIKKGLALWFCLGLATSAAAATVPCSTTYAGGLATPFTLYALNTTTGAPLANSTTTPRFNTLFSNNGTNTTAATVGFARDPVTDRLYYIENAAGSTTARVGYWDFATGTRTTTTTITKNSADTSGNFTRFGFNQNGIGYASISSNNAVYKLTPSGATLTVERLGTITGDLGTGLSGDFAITQANRAWVSANGVIYRVNLNTLESIRIFDTGIDDATNRVNGVAFDPNIDGNLLVASSGNLYSTSLGTFDVSAARPMTGQPNTSGDLANCIIPALEPNLSIIKSVSPTGPVAPGTVLTYTITVTNTGNAVAVQTTFQDSIPANTTYVAGSATKNGVAVADATGGVMPFVTAATITSPDTRFGAGIIGTGTANQATVSFKVTVNNPFPSTATSVTNQGFVEYDSGTGDTRVTQPTTPPGGGTGGTTVAVGNRDFGDAPDAVGATGTGVGNYQTRGSDNGPSHTIVSGLRLGSVVADADDGTLQDATATADNTTGTNDEEGVSSFPYISTAALQVITVPVGVTNTTGSVATLVGYIDFNKDGDFLDAGEQSGSVSVAANATSANVIFTTPTGLTAGTTYARFRISSTASEVASPVGAASSGEVEDYQVTIGSPDLTIAKTHTPTTFVRGSTGTYTLTVGNSGNQPTNGTITVVDTLPTGLSVNGGAAGTVTPGGTNAANWSCTSNAASPQVITCTSSAVIATSGSSVFTLSVNVAPGAGTPVVNTVAVSGGGEAAANNGNNTASDSAVTVTPTDLTLTKSHSGSFTVGSTGTYNFTVNNVGGVASSGTITVTDTLPTGLSFVTGSTTGTGWSCSASGQTVTCTSSTVITANGNSTFGFNVSVGVSTTPGTNSVTNNASVSGGGDANTTNNSANSGNGDPTTILSANLTLAKSHTGSFVRGSTGSYTLTVGNTGTAATNGTITVIDTLPTGLSVNGGAAGTVTSGNAAWTCSSNAASPQVITCTSSAVIAILGNSVFSLSVNVASGAGNSVMNSATVSGGGEATANNGNNTATDPTTTVAPTDLALAKTHSGDFTVGSSGTYSFTVNNSGGVASSGTITVTDTLPAGLSFVTGSTTGTGWACSASGQTVTCTSSAVIAAPGSSTFSFDVNVGVGTAPGTNSVTNTAAVSGGGDANTANNSANNGGGDPTTVLSPDLTISKTHTGNFVQGGTGNYLIRVYNNTVSTTAPTSGAITVTDTLPTGLSVPAGAVTLTAGGTVWSCTASGQTVTCTYTKPIPIGSGSNFRFNVNVASPAPASVTNNVTVSGGNEATAYAGNNSASDLTSTVDAGSLTLIKSVRNVTTNSGFSSAGSGKPGDVLEYCVAYSNPGQSPVTLTSINDTIPTTTTPLTSVSDYGNQAIRWRITQPSVSSQNLSAPSDADAGELGAVLTVRVGAVPAGGAGDICFQAQIK